MEIKLGTSLVSSIFALLLISGAFFAIVPEMVYAYQDGDYIYETSGDPLVATITGYTGAGGVIIIPSTVGGYPTVSIGNQAFMSCDTLTSVTIPDSVLAIEYAAFSSCASLTSMTIGNNVTMIGNGAFDSCNSLVSVTIPDSVITIGEFAFISCSSLTSLTIGGNVITIGQYAFESCSSLTSVIIPDSTTTIGTYAFYNCTGLTSVSIGSSLTTIGNSAFSYCTMLPVFTIPGSVTSIGTYVFQYCPSLTTINVDESNTHYRSISGVLYNHDLTTLIQCPEGKTEPVSIPSSVATIGKAAFFSCVSLTSIVIPSQVDSIGDYAFFYCPLTTVSIPNSVITIGVYAFASSPLISVTIGSRVNAIGNYAFASCASLASITFYGLVAPSYVGANWIFNTSSSLRGHAYASSSFPAPGGVWNGLTMGTYNADTNGNTGGTPPSEENQKPIADTSAGEPYQGFVNTEILFNGSKSYDPDGNITTWMWVFGDNTTGTGEVVTHAYSRTGVYIVTLLVVDTRGANATHQTTVVILTENNPPLKPLITGPSFGHRNTSYTYIVASSDADNDSLQYSLIWGDETSYANISEFFASGTPYMSTHRWSVAGRYNVTVSVTDNITESSSYLIVYIDAVQTGDIGYLMDMDSDGIYDLFSSDETQRQTLVQQKNGAYAIDVDGDGDWEYTFDVSQGLRLYEEPSRTPGFEFIVVLSAIVFLVALRRRFIHL